MLTEVINAFFGAVGVIVVFVALICLVLPRIAAQVGCALMALADAHKAAWLEFAASYTGRMRRDFPCEQSVLRSGSTDEADPTF